MAKKDCLGVLKGQLVDFLGKPIEGKAIGSLVALTIKRLQKISKEPEKGSKRKQRATLRRKLPKRSWMRKTLKITKQVSQENSGEAPSNLGELKQILFKHLNKKQNAKKRKKRKTAYSQNPLSSIDSGPSDEEFENTVTDAYLEEGKTAIT